MKSNAGYTLVDVFNFIVILLLLIGAGFGIYAILHFVIKNW
jgi:hypothetical protein